jgi:hypothetical protein
VKIATTRGHDQITNLVLAPWSKTIGHLGRENKFKKEENNNDEATVMSLKFFLIYSY